MDTMVMPQYKHRKPRRWDWAVAEILAHPLRLAGIVTAAIATGTFVFGISQPTLSAPIVPRVNTPTVLPSIQSHPAYRPAPRPQRPEPAPKRHPFVPPAPKQQPPASTTTTPTSTPTRSHSPSPTSSPSRTPTAPPTFTAPPPSPIPSPTET